MISYAAHLRVYEPLAAFPEDERRRWADYAASGRALDRREGVAAEHAAAMTALLSVPPRPAPAEESEQAFVRQQDGLTYVCPWRTRLRCWSALLDFRRGLPDALADAFIPRPVAEAAEAAYARWQTRHPDVRPAIITSTWQVPIPWFLLFEQSERHLVLADRRSSGTPQAEGPERQVVFLTAMSRARQRVARALHVLRRTFEDGPAVMGVEDLGRWLEEFHPHALVELDYGGIVHLIDDDDLTGDDSAEALAGALAALARGDVLTAQQLYQEVAGRWRRVATLESAN
ncbi:MAG TPA: hypothetical protein VFJ21_04055 [Mycobacteriales bacterium]|jgi:hypothetical protein|nr:hypothetical protein [Mycobacteriales bacterium]